MSKRYWTTYDTHPVEHLHLKKAEIDVTLPECRVTGTATIHAHRNPDGLVSLEVWQEFDGPGETERIQRRIPQSPELRFRIEPHESPDVAAFRLSSYTPSPSSH